jgi:hypothetical protein
MPSYRATGDEGLLSGSPDCYCHISRCSACIILSQGLHGPIEVRICECCQNCSSEHRSRTLRHSVLLNQCAMVGSQCAGWSLGLRRSSSFFVNPLHQIWTKFTPSRNSDFSVSLRVNTVHNCETNTRLTVVPSVLSNYKLRIHTPCCGETASQGSYLPRDDSMSTKGHHQ